MCIYIYIYIYTHMCMSTYDSKYSAPSMHQSCKRFGLGPADNPKINPMIREDITSMDQA